MVTRPGWTPEDRSWALGLALREANACPGCGGDLHETLDESNKYVPNPPHICYRCLGLQGAVKATQKDPHHRAMLHTVRRVDRPKPRKRGG